MGVKSTIITILWLFQERQLSDLVYKTDYLTLVKLPIKLINSVNVNFYMSQYYL